MPRNSSWRGSNPRPRDQEAGVGDSVVMGPVTHFNIKLNRLSAEHRQREDLRGLGRHLQRNVPDL